MKIEFGREDLERMVLEHCSRMFSGYDYNNSEKYTPEFHVSYGSGVTVEYYKVNNNEKEVVEDEDN